MPELPRPTAARLQRPSWRDVRLVVGVVLVLLAVTLGAVVVAAADDTTPVYAVTAGLVPGQVVTQQDVRRVDVRLGDRPGRLRRGRPRPRCRRLRPAGGALG